MLAHINHATRIVQFLVPQQKCIPLILHVVLLSKANAIVIGAKFVSKFPSQNKIKTIYKL